jgi:hypothetical protein
VKRRLLRFVVPAVILAAVGVWIYRNSNVPRLRHDFIPWMKRLEAWRDGIEQVRRSLRSREPTADDPSGIETLRSWAWSGMDRLASVTYDVLKPRHDVTSGTDKTIGQVLFTFAGFRPDGARVERSVLAIVIVDWEVDVSVGIDRPLGERVELLPRFRNVTAEAGLGAPRRDPRQPAANRLIAGIWPGSGVAVLDFEGDGDEDLFVGDGVRSILYENDGSGRFTDVTEKAGLASSQDNGIMATGVAAADVDGDGRPDLFVTDSFGPARLFRNLGGRFAEMTADSGIRAAANTRSAAFADIDGDGDLDLFVCVTGDYYRQMPDPPYAAEDAGPNLLFVNDGHGRFREASGSWGIAGAKRWSLSSLFADYDGDGRTDLLVTNDFGLKNLYRNDSGRRFEDVTDAAGVKDRGYGMSGAWGDFDGDGRLDIYATGCYTQWSFLHDYPGLPIPFAGRLVLSTAVSWMKKMTRGNSLLLQNANGTFSDATARSGARKAGWNWSVVAADLDDDGWPDLYATNGMWGDGRDHDRELEFWWETLAYWDEYVALKRSFDRRGAGIAGIERDRYFHNRRPKPGSGDPLFEDRAFLDGLDLETNGRAVVAFDANGDGALDLYIRSVEAPEALFLGSRREGEHFLRIRLVGSPGKDNSAGIGTRIVATLPGGRRIVLENGNASGYLSTGSPMVHLGLGAVTRLDDLTVRWPSGKVQDLGPIATIDRTLTVDRERGLFASFPPLPLP